MGSNYDEFFKKAKARKSGKTEAPKQLPKKVKRKSKKRKDEIPLRAVGFFSVLLVMALGGLVYIDDLDQVLDKVEIGVFGAAIAEEKKEKEDSKAEKKDTQDGQKEENLAADESEKKKDKKTLKDWKETDLSFLNKLGERKKELDEREKALGEVERELQEQKKMLDQKIARLEKVRNEISKILKGRIDAENEKIGKLVDFYSNMKPQQAAKVFAEIDEELAVEILGRMKKKNAAAIMNLLKPDKAQVLSEKFAGFRDPASE